MDTRLLATDPTEVLKVSLAEAVACLESGDVVAIPTETVYGLAGDAFSEVAIAKIFEAKESPSFDPLIVHLPNKESLKEVAEVPEDIEKTADKLMNLFWPGALTLILPKKESICDAISAGLPTVAVRVPAHPICRKVLKEFGRPVAAPSANRFGRISPTSASAVMEELGGRIPLILDGGACHAGVESTIVKLVPRSPKTEIHILRAGPVTEDDLRKFGKIVRTNHSSDSPEAPGQTPSHYAPRTPLRLLKTPDGFEPDPNKRYALLSYRGKRKDGFIDLADFEQTLTLSPGSGKLPEAAVRLFFLLRQLDALGVDEIIAEPVPDRGLGAAIMDRLRRASV